MQIGYIGLGKMGKNMVFHLLEQGVKVIVWNRSPDPLQEVTAAGAEPAKTIKELVQKLEKPRIIWLMLPSGPIIDDMIKQLSPLLDKEDLLIDGGNSFYKDSIRRSREVKKKNIRYMDIGVSGGPGGARTGACLMVGGSKPDFDKILTLIRAIAAPNAYEYVGPSGAGHFVKMVHNGIEYGMMEAIAEGAAVIDKSPFHLDIAKIFKVYNNRSVIESRLVGWAQEAFSENPQLSGVSSKIEHTGEGEWTVRTAKELSIQTPVIEAALEVRKKSEFTPVNFRNKVVSALRGKFGQHKVTSD